VQESLQAPLLHTSSTPHAAPQAPQLVGLDPRFGQVPPQEGIPLAQVQVPNEQICSPLHSISHSPEKASDVARVEASRSEEVAGSFTTSTADSPQPAAKRSKATNVDLTMPTPIRATP